MGGGVFLVRGKVLKFRWGSYMDINMLHVFFTATHLILLIIKPLISWVWCAEDKGLASISKMILTINFTC